MISSPDTASLNAYIQRVRAEPRLSREDEHDLAVRALKGDRRAADALVEANFASWWRSRCNTAAMASPSGN